MAPAPAPKHLSHPSSPLLAHNPHVATSRCPGFTRKAMESGSGQWHPAQTGVSAGHSSGPLERRGRLLPSPCAQQREVAWAGLGLVVSPWVRYPRQRKPFSSLMALAPPPRNSLFLPPEPIGGKHWTPCQALCWPGLDNAQPLGPGPQQLVAWWPVGLGEKQGIWI